MLCRPETRGDLDAIHGLLTAAFGREDEAELVVRLRDEGYATLSWVAELDGRVVGHILFSPLEIVGDAKIVRALALAPLAVAPDCQRQSVGTRLARAALDECRRQGHAIVVVLGHPDYYPRFGFRADLAQRFEAPFAGPSLMALELAPDALAGVAGRLRYAPPFGIE